MRQNNSFRFVLVLTIFVLVAVAVSQGSAQAQNHSLERLRQDSSEPLVETYSYDSPYPTFVRGLVPISSMKAGATDAAEVAISFLSIYGGAFGILDAHLELITTETYTDDLGMRHVTFQQVIDDIPVYNALVGVHIDRDEKTVVAASNSFVPNLSAPITTPQVSAVQALGNALLAMPNGVANQEPELTIYPYDPSGNDSSVGKLAWLIELSDDSIPSRNLYVIDAITGQIIEVLNLLTNSVDVALPSQSNTDSDDGRWLLPNQPLSGDIDPGNDIDTYFFSGQANQLITLNMRENSFTTLIDPYMSLYGPNGTKLIEDNDSGHGDNSTIRRYVLPANGTYRLETKSYNGRPGLYSIVFISCGSGGLYAEYFNGRSPQGEPVFDRCEPSPISYDWGAGGPGNGVGGDNFSVRWSGALWFEADTYRFLARVDDGVRLWVDGEQAIDAWRDQPPTNYSAEKILTAGLHQIEIEYYEAGGGAVAHVRWHGINSDSDDNRVLAPNEILAGNIFPANDIDSYLLDGKSGEMITLSMSENAFTSSLNPYLTLYDPAGNKIAEDNDSGPGDGASIVRFELPQDGRYRIEARDSNLSSEGLYSISYRVIGRYRETYNADHTKTIPGRMVRREGQGAVNDRDVDQAHDFAGTTYDYFKNTHGRTSYDNLGAPLLSTAHYDQNYNNAFWNGTQMVYGDGFAVLDVVAHELTHALTENTANLEYIWQSGAMNESFSDIFGAMIDRGDWVLGEDLPPDALGGRDGIRDLANPGRFGQPAHTQDWVYTCTDEQGVHTNSGIFNKAYYNIATALGKSKAELIFYRALSVYLKPKSSLEDGRAAAIQSAVDLYGAQSSEKSAVEKGFNDVGLDGKWNPQSNDCGGCAATTAANYTGVFTQAVDTLRTVTTLYRVRDELLAQTPEGRRLTDLYSEHSPQINRLLLHDAGLRSRGATLLRLTQPELARLADGEETGLITENLVSEVQLFLHELASVAEKNEVYELSSTINREMKRINWALLVGMSYEDAWAYLNQPIQTFMPVAAK